MIIEKLLPQELEDKVNKLIMGAGFPWYWNAENIIPQTPDESIFQFTHVFYLRRKPWSPYYNLMAMIAGFFVEQTGLKIKRIVRIKANLIPNIAHTPEQLHNLEHSDVEVDKEGNFVTFVYYVDDSDGDTVMLDGSNITSSPIKGNIIWFNSKLRHRSTVPVKHKRRVVINFILELA